MAIKIIIICISLNMIVLCNAQNKNKIMEKYDFELMNKFKATGVLDTVIHRGDTLVFVNSMFESGTFCNEYPPVPEFYLVQKRYYPNGNIQAIGKLSGKHLSFGIWRYYNEEGKLVKEDDEDEKFGKIKLDTILRFIEKEGWINLSTGVGREEIAYTASGRGYIKNGIFSLTFFKNGNCPWQYNDYPLWVIRIMPVTETNFYETVYEIHGETGEVLKKEAKQIFKIE
jgi:hypothetical protein